MADETPKPPLGESTPGHRESGSQHRSFDLSSESTPLLLRREDDLLAYGGVEPVPPSSASRDSSQDSYPKKPRGKVRWPILCMLLALAVILGILGLAFIAPAVIKQYAKEAAVFHPTNISIESATQDGVQARIQGDLVLDANRVQRPSVRNMGRFATWIGREIEIRDDHYSNVQVYLPEYGNVLVGIASLPSIKVKVQNGYVNHVDFVLELAAGNIRGIRGVAMDWLEGRLGRLVIKGSATLHLQSGFLSLGEQRLVDSILLEENDFPTFPSFKITKFNVHDTKYSGAVDAMAVDASIAAQVDSPFTLRIPPLGFEVLVPNCSPGDPHISLAGVTSKEFLVHPNQATFIDITGIIGGLSDELTKVCPGKENSPLDFLVKSYVHGNETTVYVSGADVPALGTPSWVVDILKSVTVPLPFTGHAPDNLVRNFTMSGVHFTLPNPFADPDSPESNPTVSALVKVLIGMPKQFDLHVDVPRVRAMADVYYEGNKLGVLKLPKWHDANSTILRDVDGSPALFVEFDMNKAPIEVTDEEVLADVLQTLFFEGESIELHVAANVDAEIATGLGKFAIRGVPADGQVPVKPPNGGSVHKVNPQVESLRIESTTDTSLVMEAKVNVTNPTSYSASVPYVDFVILYNATKVAHITARELKLVPGVNDGIPVDLQWSPFDLDGSRGVSAGRDLLSQYISGNNMTVTVRSHEGTIPSLPRIGHSLSRLGLKVPIPKLPVHQAPGKSPKDGKTSFIQDATFHLWTSTAEFTLSSPFPNTTIKITSINAKAFYGEKEEVGRIDYYVPFSVPPGLSKTPRLPVDLNMNGIGHDALKKALGGSLQLNAVANIGLRIQNYTETLRYHGTGITANVRL